MFADLAAHAEVFELERGLLMPAASLDDVIRTKEAADRVKDHLALPELRRIRGDRYPDRSLADDPFDGFDPDDDRFDD